MDNEIKYFSHLLLILAVVAIATIIATITERGKNADAVLEQQKAQIQEELYNKLYDDLYRELKKELSPFKNLPMREEHKENQEEEYEPISA